MGPKIDVAYCFYPFFCSQSVAAEGADTCFRFYRICDADTNANCNAFALTNTSPTPSPTPTTFPAADHVFLVVLENHAFNQVIGSPFMPYLNSLAASILSRQITLPTRILPSAITSC